MARIDHGVGLYMFVKWRYFVVGLRKITMVL